MSKAGSMNCKISCSFGEIVDKVTILRIKKEKASDKDQLRNIMTELETIQDENPMVMQDDTLFTDLSVVNKTLWDLEDNIREKSRKKEFDETYIEYAEQIHIQNDKRYQLKRKINDKYNSRLKEEKIYQQIGSQEEKHGGSVDVSDMKKLEICKNLYTSGHYTESFSGLNKLVNKYKHFRDYNSFFVDLLFSYSNVCSIFNVDNEHDDKLFHIMHQLDSIQIPHAQKKFCKNIFASVCLHKKLYLHEDACIEYINHIEGPNISPNNMSFFKHDDTHKTLLIYDGGGIGDKFMLGRFVFLLINRYVNKENGNKIVFIVQDAILWFMKEILKEHHDVIRFVSDKHVGLLNARTFDYHCSLISLIKYLNIGYDVMDTTFVSYKDKCNLEVTNHCRKILDTIKPNTVILNWRGNPTNLHEKNNRMMALVNAVPLFKTGKPINWLVLSKNITPQETKILKKYNVTSIGGMIDKDRSFYDTISILNHPNVTAVVSTDTSLPHLSLSLEKKTYVLLTTGCEWRWTRDGNTNWYPDAVLLRQEKHGEWSAPIQQLITFL